MDFIKTIIWYMLGDYDRVQIAYNNYEISHITLFAKIMKSLFGWLIFLIVVTAFLGIVITGFSYSWLYAVHYYFDIGYHVSFPNAFGSLIANSVIGLLIITGIIHNVIDDVKEADNKKRQDLGMHTRKHIFLQTIKKYRIKSPTVKFK